MPAEVLKTALTGTWVIATRTYIDKDGVTTVPSKNRYPIPEETLKQITFDFLVTEAEGCGKGYMFELMNKKNGEVYTVTVERLTAPEKVK